MCDASNFHALYFDPSKAAALQSGLFPHPCLSETDCKANKKVSPGKDSLAMMNLVRQNDVGTVMLYGTPIVSLFIDEQERLCLAQISNTLLKDFSYNEIHNRRVALGITCLQCTPVQLEILRRAGAMPVSSRRCGLITKREAERLVKSFLEDIAPPQLPDDFKFEVYHECGWGCRGSFMPSRYNSSRAKCIECHFCKGYFSPNKFIFHYHRSHAAAYRHPDAANFNSWRRHLKLCEQTPSDALIHAWEDVKAMFNGGSRKRMINSPSKVSSNSKLSSSSPSAEDIGFYSLPSQSSSFPYYPYMSTMADPMQLQRLAQGPMHPAFPRGVPCPRSPTFQSYGDVLRSLSAPYTMMWMQQPNLPKPDMNFFMRTACEMEEGSSQEFKSTKPITVEERKRNAEFKRSSTGKSSEHTEMADSSSNDSEPFSTLCPYLSPKPRKQMKKESCSEATKDLCKPTASEDELHIDVVEEDQRADSFNTKDDIQKNQLDSNTDRMSEQTNKIHSQSIYGTVRDQPDVPGVDSSGRISEPLSTSIGDVTSQTPTQIEDLMGASRDCALRALDMELSSINGINYSNMPIGELQGLLIRARKAREQAEMRNKKLQGSLEDTLRREARIKQELSEQIIAMRGTLTSEIDQERKAKELIQLRLKGMPQNEVHEALKNISEDENAGSVDVNTDN